jgi:rod shape-determining protein MreD
MRMPGQGGPAGQPSASMVVAAVAACSFVGNSIFALSGLILADPVVPVPEMIEVILVALVWDVLLTPFIVPPLMMLFRRLQPARSSYA